MGFLFSKNAVAAKFRLLFGEKCAYVLEKALFICYNN